MITFTKEAWEHYAYRQGVDRKIVERINMLIKDSLRDPFNGIGKPEPLRGSLSGFWSRRINDEHRLVYQYREDELIIISCRFHY
ncbi:MAG: Txe/YoeB family addiction module toxin [Deltaproteobacteria bacterium HGW-Deltaproteobacteria-12]|jgi:toxin YoeB|nr:MAG: Txe/YoeB family addiction module toxin [Deltaproteobacteria bacterium HGW-Deltaproteobacteria-12]